MRAPDLSEILKAIDAGIRNAQNDYKKANDSDIISEYCPEYYITVYIFQSLLTLQNKYGKGFWLSVEESVYNIWKKLKIRGRPPNFISWQGKCDLALKDQIDRPWVVVEVKKYPLEYQENIERLSYFVSSGLKYGVFASCLFEEAQDTLMGNAENIRKNIEDLVREWGYDLLVEKHTGKIQDFPEESKIYKWCPVCFIIHDEKN